MGKRPLWGSLESDTARTEATRGASQHLTGHIRGWDVGVEVFANMTIDKETGKPTPVFHIFATGGSNQLRRTASIGMVFLDDTGNPALSVGSTDYMIRRSRTDSC